MGCIYNGVCSSLVALVATGHKYCCCDGTLVFYLEDTVWEFIKIGFVFKFFVDLCTLREICLIWSYIWQEVRKCSSVSTSFCGQYAHSLSSLESQFCIRQPFSIARLCSLSLYIAKAFLKFWSVKVVSMSLIHITEPTRRTPISYDVYWK